MIIQESDYLYHTGVLGMKWGRKKGSTKEKKIRTYVDSKEIIRGRNLSQDLLRNAGILLLSSYAGAHAVKNGKVEVGSYIARMGAVYAVTSTVMDVHNRKYKK